MTYSIIFYWAIALVIFLFVWFFLPLLINVTRHWIDDKMYSASQGNLLGRSINSDGTAFNGKWLPIIISVVSFLFILWVCFK